MKKSIMKKVITGLTMCLLMVGTSQLVAMASTPSTYYSLTPAGLSDIKYTGSLNKGDTTSARNKNTAVQGGGSLYCRVQYQTDGSDQTSNYLFTTGSNISMDYFHASQYVGSPMRMAVQSQTFDVYGRNAYGYWSPDNF